MSRRNSNTGLQPVCPGIVNILSSSISSAKSKLAATRTVEELQRQIEIRDASRVKKEPLSSSHAALPPHLRRSSLKTNAASIELINDLTTSSAANFSFLTTVSALQQAKNRAEEVASKLAAHKAEVQSLSTEVDNSLEYEGNDQTTTNTALRIPTPVDIVSAELDEEVKAAADAVLADALQRKKMREVVALQRKQRRASISSAAISAASGIIDGSDNVYNAYIESDPHSNRRNETIESALSEKDAEVKVDLNMKTTPAPTNSQISSKDGQLSKKMAASDFLKLRRDGRDSSSAATQVSIATSNPLPSVSTSEPAVPLLTPLVNLIERNDLSPKIPKPSPTHQPVNLPAPPQVPAQSLLAPDPHRQQPYTRRSSFSGVPKESVQKAAAGIISNPVSRNTSSATRHTFSSSTSSIMKPFTRMFAKEGLRSHAAAAGVIMRPPPSHLAYSSTLMLPPGQMSSTSLEDPILPMIDSKEVDMIEKTLLIACEATNTPMPESIKSVLKMARSSHQSPSSVNKSSRSEYFSDVNSVNNGDSTTLLSSPRVQFNSSVVQLQSPIIAASLDRNDKVYEKVDEVISGTHQPPIEPSIDQHVDAATPAKKGVACFKVTTSSKTSRSTYDEGDDMMILPTSARNIESLFESSLENTAVDVEKQLEEEFVAKLHRLHPPLPPPLFMLQSMKQPKDENMKQLNDDNSLLLLAENAEMPSVNERTAQVQETTFIKEEAQSSSMTNESMIDEKKPVSKEKEESIKRPQVLKLKIGLRINK